MDMSCIYYDAANTDCSVLTHPTNVCIPFYECVCLIVLNSLIEIYLLRSEKLE